MVFLLIVQHQSSLLFHITKIHNMAENPLVIVQQQHDILFLVTLGGRKICATFEWTQQRWPKSFKSRTQKPWSFLRDNLSKPYSYASQILCSLHGNCRKQLVHTLFITASEMTTGCKSPESKRKKILSGRYSQMTATNASKQIQYSTNL